MYHGTPAERAQMRKTVMKKRGDDAEQRGGKKEKRKEGDEHESTPSSPAKKSKAKADTPGSARKSARTNGRFQKGVEDDDDYEETDDEDNEGGEEEEDKDEKDESLFPVILTTYEILMRDRPHLARYRWGYIVVDEGHRLKNFDCRLMREIKQLKSGGRLILSGTPLHVSLYPEFHP